MAYIEEDDVAMEGTAAGTLGAGGHAGTAAAAPAPGRPILFWGSGR